MQQSDLVPARTFAQQFGVKAVVYGGPGRGKTPICVKTAPNPVLVLSEPGALTLKDCDVPTWPAFNWSRVKEFFDWLSRSAEAKAFDTVIWDSASQGAEITLAEELAKGSRSGGASHGLKAHGDMARNMMDILTGLYFMTGKHVILICKQQAFEANGSIYYRPYFPGKELPMKIPHLYDLVMRLDKFNIPGLAQPAIAFRTAEAFESMGRDRSGQLAEFEPPNIAAIIQKCTL